MPTEGKERRGQPVDLIQDDRWRVRITFLGPYGAVPHISKEDATYRRGSNHVNVHMDNQGYRPYIRGTLVRSSLIRSVEFFIALERYILEFMRKGRIFHDLSCCPGEFIKREGAGGPSFLRRRATPAFGRKALCGDEKEACPLCLLLGRFDTPRDRCVAGRQSVHFSNFDPEGEPLFPSFESFAGCRIRNRIDRSTGKACGRYDTWEIDHTICARYAGTITFGEHARDRQALKFLTAAGLARIDTLAGAPCRVDILDSGGGITGHQDLLRAFFDPGTGRTASDRMTGEAVSQALHSHRLPEERIDGPCNVESVPTFEWLIHGRLTAETPLAVRTGAGSAMTAPAAALTSDGSLRVPHSAMRGALRATIEGLAGVEECNAGPGATPPCECGVCRILNRVVFADAGSDPGFPIEDRHRMEVALDSGTLQKGAACDLETVPRGVTFSFEMKFTSHREAIDPLLLRALAVWRQGMLFVGGHRGTGKGRMSLRITDSRLLRLTSGRDLLDRLLERGFTGRFDSPLFDALPMREIELPHGDAPWLPIEYDLTVCSPVILRNSDAVSPRDAVSEGAVDAAGPQKNVLQKEPDGVSRSFRLPFLKGESIRGLLRHALARSASSTRHTQGDCRCDLCVLLGNRHRQGLLVIEDAEPVDSEGGRTGPGTLESGIFVRTAVDRFLGGAVRGSGFEDTPLMAAPDRPLTFKGTLWARDILCEERFEGARHLLACALADVRDGLVPVGSSCGAGYGKVASLHLRSNPLGLTVGPRQAIPSPRGAKRISYRGALPFSTEGSREVYHPYYFLEARGSVPRTQEPVPHDAFLKDRYTGRLSCVLKTIGPVFIPQGNESFERGKHRDYRFIRIGGKPVVPGSAIRGAVSSVYEALTNSCLRVLDEERRLSWRMDATQDGNLEYFHPGRVSVEAGNWKIEKMAEARLPFYDRSETFRKIANPTRADAAIAKASSRIHDFLAGLSPVERARVLLGRAPVEVELSKTDRKNPHDTIVTSIARGGLEGYFKISGPNVLEIKRFKGPDGPGTSLNEEPPDDCRIPDYHHEDVIQVRIKNKERQIPVTRRLGRKEDRIIEYIMKKRCERVFLPTAERRTYRIPPEVLGRYAELVQAMKESPQAPPRTFRTFPLNLDEYTGLRDGDLVYFRGDDVDGTVIDIVPVRISRRMAPRRLGEMVERPFRNCTARQWRKEDLSPGVPAAVRGQETWGTEGLCPACHLFGAPAYKGRVRFGIAFLDGEARWYMGPKDGSGIRGNPLTLPILEAPRPAWAMPAPKSLDKEPPEVPGRKFYIHHPASVDAIRARQPDRFSGNCTVEPLGAGNSFEFEVDFHNLSVEELGLLVYSIELQEGLGHKLGKGKPLGLGSVVMTVGSMVCREGNGGGLSLDISSRKREMVESGFRRLEEWSRVDGAERTWCEIPRISALHRLLRIPESGELRVFYPTLRQDQDVEGGYPCYEAIKEAWDHEERRAHLITPWAPWYPLKNSRTPETRTRRRPVPRQRTAEGSGTPSGKPSALPRGFGVETHSGQPHGAGTLYVTNLPYSSTTDEVRNFFSKAGKVLWVRLLEDRTSGKPKGSGFVEMASGEEAARARELLHNEPLNRRPVRIDWARPRRGC